MVRYLSITGIHQYREAFTPIILDEETNSSDLGAIILNAHRLCCSVEHLNTIILRSTGGSDKGILNEDHLKAQKGEVLSFFCVL